MDAEGVRAPPLRGYRRRKAALDLNVAPSENRDHEGASSQIEAQPVQTVERQPIPARIDVDAIDDDVIESSPGAFAEATKNSRRNHRRIVLDVDSGQTTYVADTPRVKRARVPGNQTNICCDLYYINYESSRKSKRHNAINVAEPSLQPPAAPKVPTFSCPICFGTLVEEMSTKCGHIFCKTCIKTAIGKQAKCPTCRKKVTVKELIRVYLPTAN